MLYKCLRMLACVIAVSLGTAIINEPTRAEFNLEQQFPEFAKQITENDRTRLTFPKSNQRHGNRRVASLNRLANFRRPIPTAQATIRSRGDRSSRRRNFTARQNRKRFARPDGRLRFASLSDGYETGESFPSRFFSDRSSFERPRSKRSRHDNSRGYSALIAKYARANGIPIALAHAVVRIESGYRAHVRGRAGEVGLMQIKPSTARGMGYRGSAKRLYDPDTNLRWGMRYLGAAYRRAGGDICGTVLRYNAGHYARRMNRNSARYCRKARRLMAANA